MGWNGGVTSASGLMLCLAATLPNPSADQADAASSNDIVVTAERHGQARVAADREIDEAQISGFGAESIDQLLKRAAPWIDPTGEEPLLLINGKPVGFDQSILSYPAEALTRLEVLKSEAAAEYGHSGGGRVINLVLKRRFSSLNMDLGYEQPTRGGSSGQRISAGRTAIQGEWRWNANVRLSRDSALLKSARNGARRNGVFDQRGVIIGQNGGEVDPILSGILERELLAVALPAHDGPWDLEDLAASADDFHPMDPSDYETLQPRRYSASLNVGVTRPLGAFQISLNLRANQSRNMAWRGPAMAQFLWREGQADSPFGDDVRIIRPVTGLPALRVEGKNQSVGASLNLNGKVAGWQLSLGVNANRSWNENMVENGVDQSALQQQLDDGLLLPWDGLDARWISNSATKGRSDMLALQANVNRKLFQLPAGPVNLAMSFSANHTSTERQQNGQDQPTRRRQQGQGRVAFNLPINRGDEGLWPELGDLTFDIAASTQRMSGSGGQNSWSMGVNYEPFAWLQLRGSWDYSDAAPSAEQLDGPIDQNVQRIFDYARQEMADVIWIVGGNPALRRGQRRNMMLSAAVRPTSTLSYQAGYREGVARFGITALPELTPAIEAAFSDRIFRDADGYLRRIDARPINLDRQIDSQFHQSITWNGTIGAQRSALGLVPASSEVGGVGRAPDTRLESAWTVQASLSHNMRLKSRLLIHEGLPEIDQLGEESGQSRHDVSGQIGVSRTGIGVTLQGNWASGGRLKATSGQGALRFKPPLTLNLSTFIEPDKWKSKAWLKGLRVSLDVQNLTRQYRRVVRDDNSVPIGFGRDDIDPVGRIIRVTIRKKF